MAAFIVASEVRDYLGISSTTGQYSDAVIGSNIRAASDYIQRKTGRQFEQQDAATKTFTTWGRAIISIPDVRSVTTVTKNGGTLTADESYYLIPDRRTSGIHTAIQFHVPTPGMRRDDFLSVPDWWERGLDWRRYGPFTSEANDLSIVGSWGYLTDGTAPALPEEALHATKILAGFFTKRPDSVLAGVQVTPEAAVLTYREYPMEVREFIEEWRLDEQAVAV